MALYAYTFLNNSRLSLQSRIYPTAILSIPLKRFRRTPGCTFYKKQTFSVGKMYNVRILDPVEIGRCIFRGVGLSQIPESKFKNELTNSHARIYDNFLVFEKTKGKNKCILVVDPYKCIATLVKTKKK